MHDMIMTHTQHGRNYLGVGDFSQLNSDIYCLRLQGFYKSEALAVDVSILLLELLKLARSLELLLLDSDILTL